jgi:putative ATP-dependent endonuclease of OLD family
VDKAVLEAAYLVHNRDPRHEGIAIIAVDGKTKMDKPTYIFSEFGIPTYPVFDNDSKKKADRWRVKTNVLIQKVCGVSDPVEMPSGCFGRFAAFDNDLEAYLKCQIGSNFDGLMKAVAKEFDLDVDDVKKTPKALRRLFLMAIRRGCKFSLLDQLIGSVDKL